MGEDELVALGRPIVVEGLPEQMLVARMLLKPVHPTSAASTACGILSVTVHVTLHIACEIARVPAYRVW